MVEQDKKNILMIIDSNALIHRAYHALPELHDSSGTLTNAAYGFFLILFKAIEELNPKYIIATFDVAAPTFRHKMFEEYKATRIKSPDNLYSQIPIVKEILTCINIPILEAPGYEADDIIATLAKQLGQDKNLDIIIVTGDLDTLQLISDNIKVWTLKTGISNSIIYDLETFQKKYEISPQQFADYKGLKGDPSDNIPGVSGIGDKTAIALLKKHQNIEKLIEDAEKIINDPLIPQKDKKIYKKIWEQKDEALFSKQLALINSEVPISIQLNDCTFQIKNNEKLKDIFKKYGFYSLIKKLEINEPKIQKNIAASPPEPIAITKLEQLNDYFIIDTKNIYLLLDYKGRKYQEREINKLLLGFFAHGQFRMFTFGKTTLQNEQIQQSLKNFLRDKNLITFEAKIFYEEYPLIFNQYGFEDIKILAWLLNPDKKDYTLDNIAKQYYPHQSTFYQFYNNFEIEDFCFILPEIYDNLQNKIRTQNLNRVWEKIEKPLIKVLSAMEVNGIQIDLDYLTQLEEQIKPRIKNLEKEIYQLAQEEFNINSPKQLSAILFDKLKLSPKSLSKTPAKNISTGSEELKKLSKAHPIIEKIISYRELTKLINSFLNTLPSFVNPKTGRIHALWNQTGTATGRLSSDSPNLQNIPIKGEYGLLVRNCFVAQEGYSFLSFDYSQMELRIAAALSNDQEMLKGFKENRDFHRYTASLIFDVPYDKVDDNLRNRAKALNFGIIYGMGARSFSETAQISQEEAKKYINDYFTHYAELKKFIENLKEQAKINGFSETYFGRKRFLPFIGANSREGKNEERIAINMPLQGLASDLLKIAMANIFQYLEQNDLLNDVKLVAQIHDELLFETKFDIISKVIQPIKQLLENNELRIPLLVGVKKGNSWGEMQEWTL